jgi:hypothetical protein
MEAWYLAEGEDKVRYEKAMAAAIEIFQADASVSDKTNSLENFRWLLMWYILEFPSEHWKVISNRGHMELGFSLPLRGTPWYLAGAIDGYISWEPYGLLTLENKTTGMSLGGQNGSYMRQWRLSSQVTQYYWGLSRILGQVPFGVLMNCVSKRITDKSIAEFKSSYHYPKDLFIRDLQKRSARELDEFELSKVYEIMTIQNHWADWIWPKTTDGRFCTGGTGFSACQYFILCNSDLSLSEIENPASFEGLKWRDSLWQPWKRGSVAGGIES